MAEITIQAASGLSVEDTGWDTIAETLQELGSRLPELSNIVKLEFHFLSDPRDVPTESPPDEKSRKRRGEYIQRVVSITEPLRGDDRSYEMNVTLDGTSLEELLQPEESDTNTTPEPLSSNDANPDVV